MKYLSELLESQVHEPVKLMFRSSVGSYHIAIAAKWSRHGEVSNIIFFSRHAIQASTRGRPNPNLSQAALS